MMRIHRGIVCEKKSKYTVFLTNEGDFLRGTPIGATPEIGEEADFHLLSAATPSFSKRKLRIVGAVTVAALFFLFIVASLISPNDEVMAYVQLETDNAVELGVNEQGEVISLRYLNDTSDTMEKWGEKSPSIREVLDQVAKKLDEKQIIVTTIIVNQQNGHQANKLIGSALQDMQNTHKDLKWELAESTVEERELANQKRMSIQKFKKKEQAPPLKEKKPSKEIGPPEKSDSVPQEQQTESPNPKNGSTVPMNGKLHGKEKQQKPIERIESNSEKAVTTPKNPGRGEKEKKSPGMKEKPKTPASEKKNEGKKGPNPASEMKQDRKSSSNHPKEKPNTPATNKNQGNNDS